MLGKRGRIIRSTGAIILGISKALISHDENLKKNLKDKLTTEILELLNVKNTVTEKLEEAFNFLRDNHLSLTISKDDDISNYVFKI